MARVLHALAARSSHRPLRPALGVASGTYRACYFLGGLAGSAILGQLFDRFGWTACVAGVGEALLMAGLLAVRLGLPPESS